MTSETLNKIKTDLLERKRQLDEELNGVGADPETHRMQLPDYGDESDENAQEVEQYTTNLETDKVLEKTLNDINRALEDIEKGTYGICKYCGNEIEEKRLLIRPFSSSCVACKTKLQQS